jgi:hypothetical protein
VLNGDHEVKARGERISRLLLCACGEEEFPHFVSDSASLLDVCSLDVGELVSRLCETYGVDLTAHELKLPIWKLVDRLDPL